MQNQIYRFTINILFILIFALSFDRFISQKIGQQKKIKPDFSSQSPLGSKENVADEEAAIKDSEDGLEVGREQIAEEIPVDIQETAEDDELPVQVPVEVVPEEIEEAPPQTPPGTPIMVRSNYLCLPEEAYR